MKTPEEYCKEYEDLALEDAGSKRIERASALLIDQGWQTTTISAGNGWLMAQEFLPVTPEEGTRVFYLLSPLDAAYLVYLQYKNGVTFDFTGVANRSAGVDIAGHVPKAKNASKRAAWYSHSEHRGT